MQSASLDATVGPETETMAPFTDDELLAIVRSERTRSIGFDLDAELTDAREKALNYFKGEMPDMPTQKNRSQATSSDIADAVETVLPDIVEIFTGGDDVITFVPRSMQDEPYADQETDYVRKTVFDDNAGFMTFVSWFKDALLSKTGIVKSWWEKGPQVDPETFTGKTAMELELAQQDGDVTDVGFSEGSTAADAEPLFDFTIQREGPDGKVRIRAIAPEDFTVARDTVNLKETNYCAFRSRPRAQELIADGHPHDIIDTLPPYGLAKDEQVQLARDTAGEHDFAIGNEGPDRDRRAVEVVEHYVRLLNDDDKLEIWRVLTGGDEAILITSERVDRIPFASITPYIITHRYYGESLADKLIEIQKIKTALLRMALDSGYFALNQRHEVDMSGVNQFTIADLLDNRPAVPVRVDRAGTVNPLQAPQSPFDFFGALEYMSTVAEQRTGVVRNAQGLNPDTLHDTASGAAALMGAAQKRTRMIALVFAETGVKDLYLDVHALIRTHATKEVMAKLKGNWIPVDPTGWAERNDVTVEVGVGSGGKEQRMAMLTQVIGLQETVAKGMPQSGLVSPQNAYVAFMDAMKAGGLKTGAKYFTDPSTATPAPAAPPPPDPAALAAQAKAQTDQAKIAADQQSDQARLQLDTAKTQGEQANAQAKLQADQERAALDHQRALLALHGEDERARERLQAETALKQAELKLRQDELASKNAIEAAKLRQAGELGILEIQAKYQTTIDAAQIKAASDALRAHADVEIQAMESADTRLEQAHDHVAQVHDHAHEMTMELVRQSAAPEQETEE